MKKSDEFVWTDKADAALKDLKSVLSTTPVLAAPEDQEPMLLYMAATNRVVSIVIMVERKEEAQEYGVQRPVYYVSEVLTESKQRYPHHQKLAYVVFLASRKLRHYFYDHKITVVIKAPLKDIIKNSDATGRLAKWGIELAPSTSTTSLAPPSSLRLWRNLWQIARKPRRLRLSQNQSIG
jgi:dsDNA-binding SOS-regulon protein